MPEKKWVLAIDADGCIYNGAYHFMLLHILDRYDELIAQCFEGKIKGDYLFNLIEKDIQNLHLNDTKSNGIFLNSHLRKHGSHRFWSLMKKDGLDPQDYDKDFFSRYMARKKHECLKKLNALGKDGKNILKTILFYSNKPLIESIVHLAIAANYKKLIIVSGSNRQTKSVDKLDSKHNGTGRYANDLPLINEILNDLLSPQGITAVYDHYSTTKVYHSDDPVFDRTKFTLLYAIIQHYGKKIHGRLPITFIDDKEYIREALAFVFADNPELIPKDIELTIWPYNGSLRFDFPIIPGSGPIDYNYKANITKLVEMCGHDMKKNIDESFDVTKQLSSAQIKQFTEDRALVKPTNDASVANVSLFANNKQEQEESILHRIGLGRFFSTH